jgi:hypothetical protein
MIEALVSPGGFSANVLRQAHHQGPIPGPVNQSALDAGLEIGRCGAVVLDATAGPHQLQLGHTARLIGLDQVGLAAVVLIGQGTSEGKVLVHKAVA